MYDLNTGKEEAGAFLRVPIPGGVPAALLRRARQHMTAQATIFTGPCQDYSTHCLFWSRIAVKTEQEQALSLLARARHHNRETCTPSHTCWRCNGSFPFAQADSSSIQHTQTVGYPGMCHCSVAIWEILHHHILMTLSAAKQVPLLSKHSNTFHYLSSVLFSTLWANPQPPKFRPEGTTGSFGTSNVDFFKGYIVLVIKEC